MKMKAYFGLKTAAFTDFDVSSELLIVKTKSGAPFANQTCADGDVVCVAAIKAIADCDVRWKVAQEGVTIFTLPPGAELEPRVQALRQHADVTFAAPSLVNTGTRHPVFYTQRIYIQFRRDVSKAHIEAQLQASGLSVSQEVPYAANAYWTKAGETIGRKVFNRATELLAQGDVTYCYPEVLEAIPRRAAHPNQWHLQKTTVRYTDEIDASANVIAAHQMATGSGRIIAVIDDSIDIDHPELSGPGKIVYPRNFAGGKEDDPRPAPPDHHGTAVAGIACASGYHGACGVAPDALLMPIRISMMGGETIGTRAEQGAKAIRWAVDHGADIINCSWGLGEAFPNWYEALPRMQPDSLAVSVPDSEQVASRDAERVNQYRREHAGLFAQHEREGKRGDALQDASERRNGSEPDDARARYLQQFALTDELREAFEYAVTNGRSGRGCLIFCAAGNSNIDIGEHKGMATSPYVMAIGACNEKGMRSVYSNYGDALFCVFPSDDYPYEPYAELRARGIWTLDTEAYPQDPVTIPNEKGTYLQSFGGTSSAAPGAAGVAALVLQVNPLLEWQEVKQIMAKSCTRIDAAGGDYAAETGHSRQYGYGRLDAALAVKLAKAYTIG